MAVSLNSTLLYHQATKHSPESVWRGGHGLDWRNRPLPFKLYPDLDPIPLPRRLPGGGDLGQALSSGLPPEPLDLGQLARLLFYTGGVTRPARHAFFRAAPSAGALYPVEIYLAAGSVDGLEPGLYHFNPIEFALRGLREGDVRSELAEAAADPEIARRAATLVLTGIPWRTTWKYRQRGYRHLFWDSGAMIANLLTLDGGAHVRMAFGDQALVEILGLGDQDEHPLCLVPLGTRSQAADPDGGDVAPSHRVLALSRQAIEYEEVTEIHRAGELNHPDEVRRWRERSSSVGRTPTASPDPEPWEGAIDEVILLRGSTRRFRRTGIPQAPARSILELGARPVPGDFVSPGRSLLDRFVVAHAVEGMEPGAYRLGPQGLEPIHDEVSRQMTAHLCLDQPLGGDSGFTVFLMAALDEILDRLGPRGYRAAQLEAGIVAEWLHLAAYGAGLGCTGLTFYDDLVRDFLRTESEPMLVAAVGTPAYRSRPGRPPSEQAVLRLEHGGLETGD